MRRSWIADAAAGTFVLTLWERASIFPAHAHDHAQLSIVLSGGLREAGGGSCAALNAGSVLFKGAGVEHADEYDAEGAIILKLMLPGSAGRDFARAAGAAGASIIARHMAGAGFAARALGVLVGSDPRPNHAESALRGLAGVLRDVGGARPVPPEWMRPALELLERRLGSPPGAEELAESCGRHAKHVARVFRACFGQTIAQWRARRRAQLASTALLHRGQEPSQAALNVGFSDQAHMCRAFAQHLGVTPGVLTRVVRCACESAEVVQRAEAIGPGPVFPSFKTRHAAFGSRAVSPGGNPMPSLVSRVPVAACLALLAHTCSLALAQAGGDPPVAAARPGVAGIPLDAMMERWGDAAARLDAPGFSVAIVRDGRVVHAAAWGLADPVAGRPMTTSTVAYIASSTKPLIAMVVLLLAGEGVIDLDAPVSRYIPEFTLADPAAANRVTVRLLLSHTAGLRPPPAFVLGTSYTGNLDIEGVLAMLPMTDATFEYHYDNLHYFLLGRLIESTTGHRWQDEVQRRIFEPARMERASTSIDAIRADADHAESWVRRVTAWHPAEPRKQEGMMSPPGGITASANDLARWIMLNLGRGQIDGHAVLPPEVVTLSWTRATHEDPHDRLGIVQDGYALGWERATFAGHDVVMHTGDFPGCHAHMSFIPDADLGVVMLVNGSTPALAWAIASDVYRAALAPDEADPVPARLELADARRDENCAAAEPTPRDQLLGAEQLSRPIQDYVGTYLDPMFGTLRIKVENGRLLALLGGLPLHLRHEGQPDRAAVTIIGREVAATFVVEDGGVRALLMETGPVRFRFDRQDE